MGTHLGRQRVADQRVGVLGAAEQVGQRAEERVHLAHRMHGQSVHTQPLAEQQTPVARERHVSVLQERTRRRTRIKVHRLAAHHRLFVAVVHILVCLLLIFFFRFLLRFLVFFFHTGVLILVVGVLAEHRLVFVAALAALPVAVLTVTLATSWILVHRVQLVHRLGLGHCALRDWWLLLLLLLRSVLLFLLLLLLLLLFLGQNEYL
mmetsp:Transcript_34486/g.86625  ORF Transcript_34486/g.86625 Transcript_34486/m.86625 type:complete len:206 (+) Transcript_34486:835-1452(+)